MGDRRNALGIVFSAFSIHSAPTFASGLCRVVQLHLATMSLTWHVAYTCRYSTNGSLKRMLKEFGKLNEKLVAIQILARLISSNAIAHARRPQGSEYPHDRNRYKVKLSKFGVLFNQRVIEHVDFIYAKLGGTAVMELKVYLDGIRHMVTRVHSHRVIDRTVTSRRPHQRYWWYVGSFPLSSLHPETELDR